MRSLHEQLVVPVDDTAGRRAALVYAPNEYIRVVPYAQSYVRMLLYVLLLLLSGGTLGIVSVWFPQLFTQIARIRLPYSCIGDAQFMLVLVHEDGVRSVWVEVKVHRPIKRKSGANKSGSEEVATPSDERSKLPWVWFSFKKHRYVFNHEKGEFERYLATVNEELSRMTNRKDCGLDKLQVAMAKELFGENLVDIDAPFIPMLLFTKVVHPYYLFQIFSAVVWFFQAYTAYAIIILVLSAISLTWEIYVEVSNSKNLRNLVKSDHKVKVVRAGQSSGQKVIEIPETDLVPGDIIELSVGPVVADVLLLSGGCVVDEASLTGEAIPINKEPATGKETITETIALTQYKSSFLHAGSSITRLRNSKDPCKAVVLSTGFSTGKGELFRSILFPRTITFEFERDSYRYLMVLAVIAIAAFIKRVVDFSNDGEGFGYMIIYSLDLVTIAVPPALPLVMSSGIGFALERLKRAGIFCIDSQRINSCGQLDTFCFDKTGTLTEESLKLVGLDEMSEETNSLERVSLENANEVLRTAMASCHGLTEVDDKLQGYSLELAMFESSGFKIEFALDGANSGDYLAVVSAADGSGQRFGVVKRFPFDPKVQRSSVIVENVQTKQRFIFVKGSPEAISDIAVHTPAEFKQKTLQYSAEGNYCIGFGVRTLQATETINGDSRVAVEDKVEFMGMALFHNELKPESRGMIHELYGADIDVRMITGDNALTTVHVARLLDMQLKSKVAIVDMNDSDEVVYHCVEAITSTDTSQWDLLTNGNVSRVLAEYDLALTGAALETLRKELSDDSIKQVMSQTTIFARIRPTQKAWIVERLMDYGKIVGMCGDGTNDCGALKAAHVGLALSSAEASIVAPFTSKAKAVTDVPVLIREGRCALTTSFLGFKFMVLYPVIQLAMAATLGHFGTMLSNNQYLWDDLGIVLVLAITMLYTGSSTKLTKERPPHTLFSLTIVSSILGQIALFIAFFAGTFALLNAQSWFCRRDDGIALVEEYVVTNGSSWGTNDQCFFYTEYIEGNEEDLSEIEVSHEGSTIWLYGHMGYYAVALAFNLKDRFRKPCYTNVTFTALFVASLGVSLWFLLDKHSTIEAAFQTVPLPMNFRLKMLAMFIGHFVAAQIWELLATWTLPQWRQKKLDAQKLAARKSYLVAELPTAVGVDGNHSQSHTSQSKEGDEARPANAVVQPSTSS